MKLQFIKIFISFILLIISIPYANTQEAAVEQNNTRVSVYLHPVTMYYALLELSPIYLTVEIPFSLYNSLVIRPSYLNISHGEEEAFRLGSDFGFRYYLTGKGEGLYLQGQMGVFYFRDNLCCCACGVPFVYPEPFYFTMSISSKSLWLDAMGYIGYSLKFSNVSIFIDAGFGPMLLITKFVRKELDEGLLLDLNIGIGIPF